MHIEVTEDQTAGGGVAGHGRVVNLVTQTTNQQKSLYWLVHYIEKKATILCIFGQSENS
jgi:hypothetical protein